MKVIRSTDNKHIGRDIPDLNMGDTVDLGDFVFEVQHKARLESGHIILSNPNYQMECEE